MQSPLYDEQREQELLKSINEYSEDLKIYGDEPELYFGRALDYYQLSQQYYDILESFSFVGDKDKYYEYVKKAYDDVEKALSFNAEIDDYAYRFKLFMLKKLKKWDELIEYGTELDKTIGCRIADLGLMGEAYFHIQDWQNCIDYYTTVIDELGENDADNLGMPIFAERGIAYSCLEQHEQAIQDLLKHIELNGVDIFSKYDIYNLLAFEYRKIGNYEKAIKSFTKELEIYPEESDTYFQRGQIYCDCFQDYELAAKDFDNAIRYSDEDSHLFPHHLLYHYCGYSYVHKAEIIMAKDKDQALKDFDRAIEMYKIANKLEYDDETCKEAIRNYNATVKYAEHRKEDLLKLL